MPLPVKPFSPLKREEAGAQLKFSLWCITVDSLYLRQLKLYKATSDTDFVRVEPLLRGEIQGQVPGSLWSHFHQLINMSPYFVFLFKV